MAQAEIEKFILTKDETAALTAAVSLCLLKLPPDTPGMDSLATGMAKVISLQVELKAGLQREAEGERK